MFKRDAIEKKFGRIIREVVKELSKCIKVITIEEDRECPNCFIDTTTGKSSGVCKNPPGHSTYFKYGRCPVCKGEGVVRHEDKVYINASVFWRGANSSGSKENDLVFADYGLQGMTIARLKTDVCHLNLFKSCDFIIVDGIKCTLYNPPVVRGLGGKHILVVYVHGDNKLEDDEILKPTSSF